MGVMVVTAPVGGAGTLRRCAATPHPALRATFSCAHPSVRTGAPSRGRLLGRVIQYRGPPRGKAYGGRGVEDAAPYRGEGLGGPRSRRSGVTPPVPNKYPPAKPGVFITSFR